MKKRLLVLSGMFAIAIAAGAMFYAQTTTSKSSSLTMQNIEAFAQNSEPSNTKYIMSKSTIDCTILWSDGTTATGKWAKCDEAILGGECNLLTCIL